MTRAVVGVEPAPSPDALTSAAVAAARHLFGPTVVLEAEPLQDGALVLVLSPEPAMATRLNDRSAALALEVELTARLTNNHGGVVGVGVEMSGPVMTESQRVDHFLQRQVTFMARDALESARHRQYRGSVASLLETGAIRTQFQPIAEAATGRVIGYEALSRGPEDHGLEKPIALLEAARGAGLSADVDWEMRWLASTRALQLLPAGSDLLLFINAAPEALWLDSNPERELWITDQAWPWERTVTEATERTRFDQVPDLRAVRDNARANGVRFALDDVGSGYSGLAAMALLEPEFLKVDMELVRGIDRDSVKEAIMASLVDLVRRTGARIIAEGVETIGELRTLQGLHVDLVQGYLLGHPEDIPGQVDEGLFVA